MFWHESISLDFMRLKIIQRIMGTSKNSNSEPDPNEFSTFQPAKIAKTSINRDALMILSRFRFSTLKPKQILPFQIVLKNLVILGAIGVIFKFICKLSEFNIFNLDFEKFQQAMGLENSYFLSIGGLILLAWVVMKLSPQPQRWSRTVLGIILSILAARYLLWRIFSTLNLDTPLNGVFSLGLLGMELLILASLNIQFLLVFKTQDRSRDADRLSVRVSDGTFCPAVDILIPTYNEPVFILKRTIVACQALEYDCKTIYLLDDTRRPHIRNLALELGCEYITRSNNLHAKAGNLNHAIAKTKSELIVVFDADFIPTKNFLLRTVGFFQNERVALVQTPQSFYNADPIARNLGLEHLLTPEEEIFYRSIQPIRDGVGSVVCCGTSFVIRRSALEKAGGFVTESLSEDYFTGIRLSACGYRLIYLDEKLSAGLAAENIADHATQRLRWARGTLQAFFIKSNPLTIRGLKPIQRLAHLEGLLYWLTSLSRVGFLIMPLAYSFLGVIPVRSTISEFLHFCIPYYLLRLIIFYWFNYCSRSAFLSPIYSFFLAFPLAITAIEVFINPFSQGFKVTPKGKNSSGVFFNWRLALPLITLFLLTVVALWKTLLSLNSNITGGLVPVVGLELGWIWSAYNLLMIGIALLILFDAPKFDRDEWFELQRSIELSIDGSLFWGTTTQVSESGMKLELTQPKFIPRASKEFISVNLKFLEEDLELSGNITCTKFRNNFSRVKIEFQELKLPQYRKLIEILFCRPGQWKHRCAPGEIHSLWLLVKVLILPRILFDKSNKKRNFIISKSRSKKILD